MTFPKVLGRFNRHVTNPLVLRAVGVLPGFVEIVHTGRRSGNSYRTPVNYFTREGGFVIALTYGSDADWVKNVLAASGCTLAFGERTVAAKNPRIVGRETAWATVPAAVQPALRVIGVHEFLLLDES